MNLGLFRSRHALVAAVVAALFVAWLALAPRELGSRADANVVFLLTTGWVAVVCYVVLAAYAARRAAHRLRLSPEFAWKADPRALERAQSELAALQQRVLRRETTAAAVIRAEAKAILRRHGVHRVLRCDVVRDTRAIGLLQLQVGPRQPLGTLAAWLHAHLFYGFLAALLVWFHGGLRCGSTMGLLLNVLSGFVIASGVFGAAMWTFGPTWLTRAERDLTIEQAIALRAHFARKIPEAEGQPAALAKLADEAAAAAEQAARTAADPALAGKEATAAKTAAKKKADEAKRARDKAEASTTTIPRELATLRGQAACVATEVARLGRYRALLRGWRLVHVPCSVVLLALVGVHVLSIWYY
jgi:hypothetical protein